MDLSKTKLEFLDKRKQKFKHNFFQESLILNVKFDYINQIRAFFKKIFK